MTETRTTHPTGDRSHRFDEYIARLRQAHELEQRGDPRGRIYRLRRFLAFVDPDHPDRPRAEQELSSLWSETDPAVLKPWKMARPAPPSDEVVRAGCACRRNRQLTSLHKELQDTECAGWKRLLDLVEQGAAEQWTEFRPEQHLTGSEWKQIVTLPATISKLKHVRHLDLNSSHLVRIPPEIGEMSSLETFEVWRCYRLHWYPYEITRCRALRDWQMYARALYGERLAFPSLEQQESPLGAFLAPDLLWPDAPRHPTRACSVCGSRYVDEGRHRVWITLQVATGNFPLLVNACSDRCVHRLPKPPKVARWVPVPTETGSMQVARALLPGPHRGGLRPVAMVKGWFASLFRR